MFGKSAHDGRATRPQASAQRGQGQMMLVWGIVGAAVIVAALVGFGAYVGVKRHQDTKKELLALRETGNELIDQQRRLVDGKASNADAPVTNAGETVPARNETEMLRGFNAALREVGGRNHQQQARIAAEVKALDLPRVLAPDQLTSAQGRRAGRDTAQRYLALIERSAAEGRKARTDLRARVEILVSQLPKRNELLAQYDRSTSSRIGLEEQLIRNQREACDLLLQAIELMEKARNRVQIQGGQLAFTRQSDLDAYNGIVERIQAAGREEERLAQRDRALLDQAQAQFDKVSKM
ncbi:hypothetical protein ACI2IY_18520 [Lysobacter enzymogenes]|uniref:hypothetical protein n=1 Tax=Lysobacter enzymogenes TaxID=69 RepID=UPI00384D6342